MCDPNTVLFTALLIKVFQHFECVIRYFENTVYVVQNPKLWGFGNWIGISEIGLRTPRIP